MSRAMMFLSCMAVLVIAVGLSGCGGEGEGDSQPAVDPPEATGNDEHAGHDHGEGEHDDHMMSAGTEVEEALAELSPADRAAAEKQQMCPVTDEPLGSMGKPYKITHEGTDVFFCCEMCKDSFTDDPGKYLAKLNE